MRRGELFVEQKQILRLRLTMTSGNWWWRCRSCLLKLDGVAEI